MAVLALPTFHLMNVYIYSFGISGLATLTMLVDGIDEHLICGKIILVQ